MEGKGESRDPIAPSSKLPAHSSVWVCAHETALTEKSDSGIWKKYWNHKLADKSCGFQAFDAFFEITCFTELGAMSLKKIQIVVILFRIT